jgi:hypothetical protein
MKPEVQAAVDKLIASYGDVKREAKAIQLDANDVREEFLKSMPGTVEHYVLALLHDNNPVGTMTATVINKGKKSKAMLINDVVLPDSVIEENADSPAE